MSDLKIREWVTFAIKNQNLVSFSFEVHGKTNKDDGYLSNIAFVTVTGYTKDKTLKQFELMIKSSKESENLRNQFPIEAAFKKEIYMYDQVRPAFEKFAQDKGVAISEILPGYFAMRINDTSELLILENLKPKGFGTYNRKIPMTLDHVQMLLKAYGEWHAFSLALKRQRPKIFEKLTENNVNIFSEIFKKDRMIQCLSDILENAKKTLTCKEALKQLQFSQDDLRYIMRDLYFEDPEYQVILHGDCWTNNFLFRTDVSTKNVFGTRLLTEVF